MKQRELEMLLQKVPPHARPRPELEQYATPAPIAADLLYKAHALGDIAGKAVLDLGCGTGTLAIGAALLGAKRCTSVDLDEAALTTAEATAEELGVGKVCTWQQRDAGEVREAHDTCVMNPPFGAQTRHADQPFHLAALACAPVVLTLVNGPARAWAERFYVGAGARVTHAWPYAFPIAAQFWFHDKPRQRVEVWALRAAREK
ncbi:MAG: METTL5 family protein [Halobacteriales archaeon]|nr:METTL5 family protein [Halobacteriales archaeon]